MKTLNIFYFYEGESSENLKYFYFLRGWVTWKPLKKIIF